MFFYNSSIIPRWEELVVFNDEFRHFIKEKPNVLILFELLDTHKPLEEQSSLKQNYLSEDTSKSWQRIAWAFLKVKHFNNIRIYCAKLYLDFNYTISYLFHIKK